MLALSFLIFVVAPVAAAGAYLYRVATDQYASHVAFSVRTEDVGSPVELLGGLTDITSAASSDTDILFDFMRSQRMVAIVAAEVDLPALWTRSDDPVFSLGGDHSIEALHSHWSRMVRVRYDPASGLIDLRTLAFAPGDAQVLAQAIFAASTAVINDLNQAAQSDATRFAEAEFARATRELSTAQAALTAFRTRTRLIDPNADVAGQTTLVASLQSQLAEAMIDLMTMDAEGRSNRTFAREQAEARIGIIEDLIARQKAATTTGAESDVPYAALVAEYEGLVTNLAFAREAYVAARASYDAARAEAQRQTRYLAAHVPATLAETALYPRRAVLLSLWAAGLMALWIVLSLGLYAVRDRR
ncbi:MAG: sugar transporter [Pseudomonadota bacterium]